MTVHPVLIGGEWRESAGAEQAFHAINPSTGEALPECYPLSPLAEIELCLEHAAAAASIVRTWPGERFARFLDAFAAKIEHHAEALVAMAHQETGLPVSPRLKDAELPRTVNQLRQAATAARDGSWSQPTIDTAVNIRSQLEPIGPVAVFGPNNFPFAFNSAAGGDFAAAIAAGNPVIAKAHTSHPGTTRLFSELAHAAAQETQMPPGYFQVIYRCNHADGVMLAKHPLLGAIGYTGSRTAGTQLKTAADAVGKPIYLELSSINPVFVLPGAVAQHATAFAEQFAGSCLMGTGQFCTNPGLVITVASPETETMLGDIAQRFAAAPVGVLLSESVLRNLKLAVGTLVNHGAALLAGGQPVDGAGYRFQNTLLKVTAQEFIRHHQLLQTEAFGNASLVVVANSADELLEVTQYLEGNLTGTVYSAADGSDDELYQQLEDRLRPKVGRLINDKMPTGVAVVPAMNHGGPFPATGHPVFTAVGIPAALRRFSRLACYDAVRPSRLPAALQDKNPTRTLWRMIDGQFTQADVVAK
ncbi:aldehyde dehydrogenase family protein [bacterium]|nr:aldehyde dehydrogenase family protein [bacterium]